MTNAIQSIAATVTAKANLTKVVKLNTSEQDNKGLSANACNSIIAAVKGVENADKLWVKCADMLHAEGVRAANFADSAWVKDVKYNVIARGLPANMQKDLEGNDADTKRVAQQRLGVYINRLKKYIVGFDTSEATEVKEKTTTKSTLETRLKKGLITWIDRIEKAEGTQFATDDMLRLLRSASALIK